MNKSCNTTYIRAFLVHLMCHDLLASSLVIQSQGGSQLMETQAVVDRLNEQDRLQDSRIEQ